VSDRAFEPSHFYGVRCSERPPACHVIPAKKDLDSHLLARWLGRARRGKTDAYCGDDVSQGTALKGLRCLLHIADGARQRASRQAMGAVGLILQRVSQAAKK